MRPERDGIGDKGTLTGGHLSTRGGCPLLCVLVGSLSRSPKLSASVTVTETWKWVLLRCEDERRLFAKCPVHIK